jgi:hypothetical protein
MDYLTKILTMEQKKEVAQKCYRQLQDLKDRLEGEYCFSENGEFVECFGQRFHNSEMSTDMLEEMEKARERGEY